MDRGYRFDAEDGEITEQTDAQSQPMSTPKEASGRHFKPNSLFARTVAVKPSNAEAAHRSSRASQNTSRNGFPDQRRSKDYSHSRSRSRSRSNSKQRHCTSNRHRSRSPARDEYIGDSKQDSRNSSAIPNMKNGVNTVNTGDLIDDKLADAIDVGDSFSFVLNGIDNDEEDRFIEERRRRRLAILKQYDEQAGTQNPNLSDASSSITGQPPTATASKKETDSQASSPKNAELLPHPPSGASTASAASVDMGFLLAKKGYAGGPLGPTEATSSETGGKGVSAADYNPNTDSNEDDIRRKVLAKTALAAAKAAENKQAAITARILQTKATDSSQNDAGGDDDDFDMFADDDGDANANDGAARHSSTGGTPKSGLGAVPAAVSMTADSWDDAEGYYRTIVGELLDDQYLVQASLGQGVFSSVVRAIDTRNEDMPVAIKIIRQNEVMYRAGIKEQKILERLNEADPKGKMHVVRLLKSFVHRGHLCLCFELMNLNLREVVRRYGRDEGLSLEAVRVYGMHLFLALDLLRRCSILHGDLKPDNCLVSGQRNIVKLGDLGSACDAAENEITPYLVSRFYRAPEIILGIPYDYAIDMWSLGATLFELYTGHILFPGRNNNHMLRLMMEARGHFPNRMIRRGQFWQQHFEDKGGSTMEFISSTIDKVSNKEATRRMVFTKPTHSIKTRILEATPAGSSQAGIQSALQFANLLERCLELGPEKRITPSEALQHPFFAQK